MQSWKSYLERETGLEPATLCGTVADFLDTDGDALVSATVIAPQLACNGLQCSQTKEVSMPKRHMGNKHSTDAEAKPEQAAEPTPEVIAPEDEVHPHNLRRNESL